MRTLYVAFKGNGNSSNRIVSAFNYSGLSASIGNRPTNYLCNEAFWYMLKKYNHHVVFLHVPSIRYIDESVIGKIKAILNNKE